MISISAAANGFASRSIFEVGQVAAKSRRGRRSDSVRRRSSGLRWCVRYSISPLLTFDDTQVDSQVRFGAPAANADTAEADGRHPVEARVLV